MCEQHIFVEISNFLLKELLFPEQVKARDFFYSLFGLRNFGTLSEEFRFNCRP